MVRQTPEGGEAGFTLVEVIAAFAILAVASGVLMSVISDGISRLSQAEMQGMALSLAQSLVAEAGRVGPLQRGEQSGQYDNGQPGTSVSWRLRVEPYEDGGDRREQPVAG